MIKLSHITSYLTCPRLSYYRFHFGERSFTEKHAVREIYLSLRRGLGVEWAKERARATSEVYDEEVFNKALEKFKFSKALEELKAIEWDTVFVSEKFGVTLIVDEIVEFRGEKFPLFLSLDAPEKGVWFQDAIKAAIAALVAGFNRSIIYYTYSGDLRVAEVNFALRRKALKLIERLKMIENGFFPERKENPYCTVCKFSNDCKSKRETFASKFL
ncbi:MAG: hypothetical protein QXN34_01515 [Archaeoglobaceae archaeon]